MDTPVFSIYQSPLIPIKVKNFIPIPFDGADGISTSFTLKTEKFTITEYKYPMNQSGSLYILNDKISHFSLDNKNQLVYITAD